VGEKSSHHADRCIIHERARARQRRFACFEYCEYFEYGWFLAKERYCQGELWCDPNAGQVQVRDHQLITTQRAAEILGMSRDFFDKLLDEGVMSQHKIGNERRVYIEDVLAYAEKRSKERSDALDRMSRDAAQAGLYDRNKFPEGGQDE